MHFRPYWELGFGINKTFPITTRYDHIFVPQFPQGLDLESSFVMLPTSINHKVWYCHWLSKKYIWSIISCYNMKCKALRTGRLPDGFVLLHGLRADAAVPDQPENEKGGKSKWQHLPLACNEIRPTGNHLVTKRFLFTTQKIKHLVLIP